ncbi:MAG: nuclear transport factor 2 family protein [Phycisphaeraceae bacterium]|nr:nuclear transport factor 2 family protein [Phycisphaeraceae bacterium]MCB9848748.1 nuclear transport factor 2 family protein [Phycisphaeraceae bacterium]
MTRHVLWAGSIALSLTLLSACATTSHCTLPQPEWKSAEAALLEADFAWNRAAAGNDLDALIAFWTEDAVIGFQDGPPPIVGRDAIRDFLVANRDDPAFSISWTPHQAWVSGDGSTGTTFGIGTIHRTAENGRVMSSTDPYVCVWRYEDGAWRCALDLRSPNFD